MLLLGGFVGIGFMVSRDRRRRPCAVAVRPALSPEGAGLRYHGCHRHLIDPKFSFSTRTSTALPLSSEFHNHHTRTNGGINPSLPLRREAQASMIDRESDRCLRQCFWDQLTRFGQRAL